MAFQRLQKPGQSSPAPAPVAAAPQRTGGFQRLQKPGAPRRPGMALRPMVRPIEGATLLARPAGGGGFLGRFGSDVLNVITGLPAGAKTFVVNPVVASGETLYGGAGAALHAATGLHLPGAESALGASAHIQRQGGQVVKATVKDYEQRYGPVVHAALRGDPLGTVRAAVHAASEHPGLFALDIASAASGAGALARGVGGLAARVAPEAAIGRVGARAANTSIRGAHVTPEGVAVPAAPRYRPPTRLESPVAPGTTYGARAAATIHYRPYSRNPLTRELVQKPVGRLVERRVRPSLADAAPRLFGEQKRFERATARSAREIRLSGEEHLNATVGELAAPYAKAAQKLRPIQTGRERLAALPRGVAETVPHERDVVHLHLRGLLDQPGMTLLAARDRLVNTMRTNIEAAKANGERTAAAEKNVTRFAAIPEHYLNLETAPEHVRTAVQEGRTLIDETQRRAVQSGLVTPETAKASAERAVNVLLGGAKWDPEAGAIVKPAGFQAGPQARYLPDIAADRVGSTAIGRATGRLTKPRTYQSHGTLIGRGGVVTSPHLPVHATRTALAHEQLTGNVANLIEQTAFRHEGGQVARGPKALQLLRADPDRVVLVSARAVQHALSQLDELQPGHALNETTSAQLFHEAAPDEATFKAHPNDFIAIPKAAMNEWRQAAKAPTSLGRGYDSVLSLWKSGLLAFTPRWYTNNLITNAALYGLASGGDLTALREARAATFKRAGVVPERVASTAATEYGRTAPSLGRVEALPRVKNAAARGFALNNRLEAFWRRAAYIHAAKGLLRDEGGKFRKLSQEEVADRVASMPDELKREAIRITEDAMGNFRNFNPIERNVLKRVFPFYSWMRFVGSLTIGLPLRSPLRAEALAVMSEARRVENPEDEQRPLYQRGRINLPGGLALPTTGMNPFSTVQDFVATAASGAGPGDVATESLRAAAQQGASPVVQIAAGTWSGRNPFTGRDYSAPPGYGGSVAKFGQEPQRFNQSTGQWETYRPTPSIFEQVLEAAPYIPQLRSILAGGQRPYDTTSVSDLIQHRLGGGPAAWQLYQPPPTRKRGTQPLPYISPLASLLGFNIQQVDPAADRAAYQRQLSNAAAARGATKRAQGKARARVGG